MSRRSPVATLLRIAELQEAVARGAAGRALAATQAADLAHEQELANLRAAGLAGGTRQALESTSQVRLWRAAAVVQSAADADETHQARAAAIVGWTEARRRHRLFEELAARHRAEALLRQERIAQRLSDDLAGLRRSRR